MAVTRRVTAALKIGLARLLRKIGGRKPMLRGALQPTTGRRAARRSETDHDP
jgi:hypothetical protein